MKHLPTLLLLALSFAFNSCGSSVGLGNNSDSLTSVEIKSTDLERARRVTRDVFTEEGFRETGTATNTIFFTKDGGRSAMLAWGGWGDEAVMISPEVYVGRSAKGISVQLDLYVSRDC